MQILCPECQSAIPAADVELGRGLAKCGQCDSVFDFTDQVATEKTEISARNGTTTRVLVPRGFRELSVDNGIAFDRRWFGLRHGLAGALGLGFTGFLSMLDSAASVWPLAALPWAVALGGLAYAAIGAVNRTTVTVDPEGIRIAHAPVPWFGSRMLYRGSIEGVYVLERISNNGQARIVRYEVWAKLTAGRATKVVGGLQSPHEACYIEDRLRVALELETVRVSGAFQPLPGTVPTEAPSSIAGGLAIPDQRQGELSEAPEQDVDLETPLSES